MPDPVVISLPPDRTEAAFSDSKPPMTPEQATADANRCLFCSDAPCVKACPTAIDIPQFIRKIATSNVRGSARTIFESNILGMSCARVCPVEVLCVGACVYNEREAPPIQIGRLQRFATDAAYEHGWRFFEAGADTGKSVGFIGAGPASLAAAHELRRFGHRCTIYEQRSIVGGLNSTGVAPYKMRAEKAVEEANWVLRIGGIDVRRGVTVGEGVTLEDLERRHDAVFVGVGLGADSMLGVPGENLPGVRGAVDWIEEMKTRRTPLAGVRRGVVVGGGNTAMDVLRELSELGVPDVVMVYRGDEPHMPGYAHEWAGAKEAGARAQWRSLPVAFEGAGRIERVRCVRLDENKRPLQGSEFVLEADLALLAIGQSKLGPMLSALAGITLDRGRVVVDANGFTGRKGWYAGGDCANGGKEVVNAAAEGKAAARAIHAYLAGGAGDRKKGGAHA